jgi:pyruvate,water dikinase
LLKSFVNVLGVVSNLYWLDQIQPDQLPLVGYKAFHLGCLLQKGYPVPSGFVVSSQTFRRFLDAIPWPRPLFQDFPNSALRLDVHNPRQLQAISRQFRQLIESAPIPVDGLEELATAVARLQSPTLILRPSIWLPSPRNADISPSQPAALPLKTSGLLNIQLASSELSSLTQHLKQLWADLFSAKGLFYWQDLGIQPQTVKLAVLIQPIQSAIAAGTIHTTPTQFTIQAVPGLGILLDRGESTPDTHQINAETEALQSQQLGWKTIAYQIAHQPSINQITSIQTSSIQATSTQASSIQESSIQTPEEIPQPLMLPKTRTTLETPLTPTLETMLEVTPEPILASYALDEEQQQQYELDESSLRQLVQLVGSIVAEMGSFLDLEWVLNHAEQKSNPKTTPTRAPKYDAESDPDTAGNGCFYITQITPWESQPNAKTENTHSQLPPWGNRRFEKPKFLVEPPDQSLIATGLPAAAGQVIAMAYVIPHVNLMRLNELPPIPPYRVLIAPMIPLEWMPLIGQAAALVTEQGGMTSHSAIIARDLQVPAVMGVSDATSQIQTGELLWVDGDRGKVYRLNHNSTYQVTEPISLDRLSEVGDRPEVPIPPLGRPSSPSLPSSPSSLSTPQPSPTRTKLMLNLRQVEQLQQIRDLPIAGVGLLRGELLALSALDAKHPQLWLEEHSPEEFVDRIASQLSAFAHALTPRPVFYRSFDLRSHEFPSFPIRQSRVFTNHPMLGIRGTFSYCLDATLFKLELAAIARVQTAGYSNLNLLLPFVRTVEEFRFCRQQVAQAKLFHHPDFQLWIMAEVPSVLLLLPDYVEAGVQGISIGTNDLTQLLLGVDRDQAELAAVFDAQQPALQRAIAHLIQQAHTAGIPCSICGEAPVHHPQLITQLVQWGIDAISVSPDAVQATHQAILRAEQSL